MQPADLRRSVNMTPFRTFRIHLARFTLGLRTHGTREARLFRLESELRLQPESEPR